MDYPKTLNKEELITFLEDLPLRMIVTQVSEKTIVIQKLEENELSIN